MSASVSIAALSALVMIISVLFKPYLSFGKIKVGLYVIVCIIGAAAELLFGGLSVADAVEGLTATDNTVAVNQVDRVFVVYL